MPTLRLAASWTRWNGGQLLNRTIVVVAADHGESLGEHGERDHGIFVYENMLRIPLIIRAPGVAPRRVASLVRLTDVMPTVLELLDVRAPAADGVSLVDLMAGRRAHLDLEGYSESLYPRRFGWSPLHALRDGRFKLIDAPRPELYDLQRDPFEQHNLYDERRAVADALARRLADLARGRSAARTDANEPALPSAELRQRLAALGYVGSLPTGPLRFREALPDPKDCIGLHSLRLGTGGSVPAGATARCK